MNRLDDFFKQKTEDFKPSGGAPSWQAFTAVRQEKRKKKAIVWFRMAAALALLLITGWWVLNRTTTPTELAKTTATEQPAATPVSELAPTTDQLVAPSGDLMAHGTATTAAGPDRTRGVQEQGTGQLANETKQAARQYTAVIQEETITAAQPAETLAALSTEESKTISSDPEAYVEITALPTVAMAALPGKSADLTLIRQELHIQTVAIQSVAIDSLALQERQGLLATIKNFKLKDLRQAKDELFAKATSLQLTNPLKNSK